VLAGWEVGSIEHRLTHRQTHRELHNLIERKEGDLRTFFFFFLFLPLLSLFFFCFMTSTSERSRFHKRTQRRLQFIDMCFFFVVCCLWFVCFVQKARS